MTISTNYAAYHHISTGTNSKTTEAIVKDSSTVKTLAANLQRVGNRFYGHSEQIKSQTNILVELTSTDRVNAKEVQMYARATKQILREEYKQIRNIYNANPYPVHPDSVASGQIGTAYKAYQLAKAIQHNNARMLPADSATKMK